MNPLGVLNRKAFLISVLIYDWTKEILKKIDRECIVFPKINIYSESLALEWINCELYIYDYFAILITDVKKNLYTLPDDIDKIIIELDSIIFIKRSRPLKIEK